MLLVSYNYNGYNNKVTTEKFYVNTGCQSWTESSSWFNREILIGLLLKIPKYDSNEYMKMELSVYNLESNKNEVNIYRYDWKRVGLEICFNFFFLFRPESVEWNNWFKKRIKK